MAKVSPEPNTGCWLWVGACGGGQYGSIAINRRTVRSPRVAWELFIGPIGDLDVLHRCDQPLCVNPAHLFLGTHLDNMQDRDAKGRNGWGTRTHCSKGHEYTPENTYWRKDRPGHRMCRACNRAAQERFHN